MSADDKAAKEKSVVPSDENAEQRLQLRQGGNLVDLDLSGLSDEQRNELVMQHARGHIDLDAKALELGVSVQALGVTLDKLSKTTQQVSDAGDAVRISHTTDSVAGRTEIVMRNTDEAERRKLSRTQTGATNWMPYYVFGAIAAVVIVSSGG